MNAPDWLDGIDIAAPCTVDWNHMQGDDRCRFCSQCSLHVFDLSAMTRHQAETLVRERLAQPGRRLCVRFRRRADGTVLTRDCPVGLRARLRRAGTRVAAAFAALLTFAGCRKDAPASQVPGTVHPVDTQTMGEVEAPIMGDMIEPPPVLMGRLRAAGGREDAPK